MDDDESENREHAGDAQSNYPEPSRAPHNPYPAIPNSAYPSFPGSAYGTSPGGSRLLPGALGSYALSGSQSPQTSGQNDANTTALHHSPDFRSFGENGGSAADPSRLTAAAAASQNLSEAQRLAQQFQIRHGHPGSSPSPAHLSPLPHKGTESSSSLAGVYQDDVGGKAAARRAWQAAATYGGQYEYDPDYEEEPRDLELDRLLEEADLSYVKPRRGPIRAGRGRGGWRKLLKGTEHEQVGRSKSGRGRGAPRGRRGRGRGRGKAVDPGREFKNFLQVANKAFVDGNLEEAADNAKQAVLANPEIYQAHALLSQILTQMGRHEDAVAAIFVGANTARDPEVWIKTADKILELAGEGRDRNRLRQAVDCFAEALKLAAAMRNNPQVELELRSRALELYEELGDVKYCRVHCRSILKQWPGKTEYVRRYAVLCAQWQDHQEMIKAKECYEKAFEIYKDDERFGDGDDPTDPWSHLNIYLELYDLVGKPVDGIAAAKRLARWFLGRKDESFWDRYALDDREFDDDNIRRHYVGEFQQGRASRDPLKYGEGLPIDIRVRLGLFRLKMGSDFHDEAVRHFKPLVQYTDSIDEYYDMFLQVGAALRDAGFVEEAVEYYEPVRNMPGADDTDNGLGELVWMQLATCYQVLHRTQDAIACYEVASRRKGQSYTRACARLAKLYESTGEADKARLLCDELIKLNRRDLLYEAGVLMIPPPKKLHEPPSVSTSNLSQPTPPPPPVLYGLASAECTPQSPTTAQILSLGPQSQPVVLPPAPADEAPKKRKPRGKKRGILSTIYGDVEDPELADEEDGSGLKRPRLKRKYPRKPTLREQEHSRLLHDAEARTHANYAVVQSKWNALKEGTDEEAVEQWMEAAHAMLDDFNSMKVFFPERDMHLKVKESDRSGRSFAIDTQGNAIESGPKQFLGIPFKEWHHVFTELSLLYVSTGEQDRCYKIVQEVLLSANVFFHDPELNNASYGVAVHVGLAFNDSHFLIQLARQLIASKPADYRNSMAFQLFAAVSRFSYGNNWFISGPSQKFMLRAVKQNDYMAMAESVRERIDWAAQAPSLKSRAKNYSAEEVPDAHVLTMYGHMVAAANHSFSALPYYYRALALQPDNICVNLSIATMWIQNSMKRQTDNRQLGITQGLSFLYRYYDLRVASGRAGHIQEAEYNVARMWHYLGLTHLALPAYEKVLQLSEMVQAERLEGEQAPLDMDVEDYAQEAAYALQNMYALVGNLEAARGITEAWLVI